MRDIPKTRYAKAAGDINIAYQVVGSGPVDLVFVPGFVSNLELVWGRQRLVDMWSQITSFARLILFDKRGSGLSDPIVGSATLEERMDDVRAVMDAVGSERAVLFGYSEGAPMCLLFAATYPQRTRALVLFGAMARSTEAPDYPFAPPASAQMEASAELLPYWGQGVMAEIFSPSVADLPETLEAWGQLERTSASPGRMADIFLTYLNTDVRDVLPIINAPTLLLHRKGDRVVNIHGARWLAQQIPNATLIEFPGIDHAMWIGEDWAPIMNAVEEFVTGAPPVQQVNRVLATVLFTDVVDSTRKAAEVGDARWRATLDEHDGLIDRELRRFRGTRIHAIGQGDGVLATFDGPARGIACAKAIVDSVRTLGIECRAGLHTGEVELREQDIGGIAVHIAARVKERAGAGEVLVSGAVPPLVAGSGLQFEERGEHDLKGVPGTWVLFALSS